MGRGLGRPPLPGHGHEGAGPAPRRHPGCAAGGDRPARAPARRPRRRPARRVPARLGGVHPRRPGPGGLPGRAARGVAGRGVGRRRGQPAGRRMVRPRRGVAAAVRPRAPELRHLPRPLADPAGRPALVPPGSVGDHRRGCATHRRRGRRQLPRRRAAHPPPPRPGVVPPGTAPGPRCGLRRGRGCGHRRRPTRAAVGRRADPAGRAARRGAHDHARVDRGRGSPAHR